MKIINASAGSRQHPACGVEFVSMMEARTQSQKQVIEVSGRRPDDFNVGL